MRGFGIDQDASLKRPPFRFGGLYTRLKDNVELGAKE